MHLFLEIMKKMIAVVCVICLLPFFLYAHSDCNQCFDTPWTWPITSDYGPRNVGTWFHKGIDYAMPRNTGIIPIENGVITGIFYDSSGGGWTIIVEASNIKWHFLHTFTGISGTLPVYSCPNLPCTETNRTWELRNAILVNPDDENDNKMEWQLCRECLL